METFSIIQILNRSCVRNSLLLAPYTSPHHAEDFTHTKENLQNLSQRLGGFPTARFRAQQGSQRRSQQAPT